MKVWNVDDCVKKLSSNRLITQVEAQEIFDACMEVLFEALVDGGVSIRDLFTIKQSLRKGRKGVVNGEEFYSRDITYLKIRAGKKLSKAMN